ncbi:uncharacterized protein LOC144653619 [Oculina patagonica]
MEPNDKHKMLTLLLVVSVATFVLMAVAICFIVETCRNVMNAQPRVQAHNRPPVPRQWNRRSSINHNVCTHRRRPQENDELPYQTDLSRGTNPDAVAAPVAAPVPNAITP